MASFTSAPSAPSPSEYVISENFFARMSDSVMVAWRIFSRSPVTRRTGGVVIHPGSIVSLTPFSSIFL